MNDKPFIGSGKKSAKHH